MNNLSLFFAKNTLDSALQTAKTGLAIATEAKQSTFYFEMIILDIESSLRSLEFGMRETAGESPLTICG